MTRAKALNHRQSNADPSSHPRGSGRRSRRCQRQNVRRRRLKLEVPDPLEAKSGSDIGQRCYTDSNSACAAAAAAAAWISAVERRRRRLAWARLHSLVSVSKTSGDS